MERQSFQMWSRSAARSAATAFTPDRRSRMLHGVPGFLRLGYPFCRVVSSITLFPVRCCVQYALLAVGRAQVTPQRPVRTLA